jgi:hypothetical protein
MTNCKNCNHQIIEKFCANCGQPAILKRIDKHYISHELFHLLHFEKGFFYTVKKLMTTPGSSIRGFIHDNRNKDMKPVAFLILTSLLYTLVAHFFHTEELYKSKEKFMFGKSSINDIQNWVQAHLGYANILMGGFITLCVKLFFRKYKYNLFEITILLCFVMGQGMLLLTVETLFTKAFNERWYLIILSIISFGYPTWAIGQFFDGKKIGSYFKAFFAYLFGYLLFQLAVIIIGLIADVIIKMM